MWLVQRGTPYTSKVASTGDSAGALGVLHCLGEWSAEVVVKLFAHYFALSSDVIELAVVVAVFASVCPRCCGGSEPGCFDCGPDI